MDNDFRVKRNTGKTKKSESTEFIMKVSEEGFFDRVLFLLFPSIPNHYPLRKKIQLSLQSTWTGSVYLLSQDINSILLCFSYVIVSYARTLNLVKTFLVFEIIVTQYCAFDFVLNWYIDGTWSYLIMPFSLLDLLTLLPTYYVLVKMLPFELKFNDFLGSIIQLFKVLRILRLFKLMRFKGKWNKQVSRFTTILVSIIFITSGVVEFLSTTYPALDYDCQFINEGIYNNHILSYHIINYVVLTLF